MFKSKMACIENIPPANGDSEMEEGEIVDDLDDLSDISSEEEFLLRQRLQVLENYNNVLERKKAKNSSFVSGKTDKCVDLLPQDLSEISASENEEPLVKLTVRKNNNNNGQYGKHKKKKEAPVVNLPKNKESKKKTQRVKKKLVPKVVFESSDESDDEYRTKRRRLANAVVVNTPKTDSSTLRARLRKMFGTQSNEPVKEVFVKETPKLEIRNLLPLDLCADEEKIEMNTMEIEKPLPSEILDSQRAISELIDLCNDDEVILVNDNIPSHDTVDGVIEVINPEPKSTEKVSPGDSDEDLELLRQHALKTKSNKPKTDNKQEKAQPEIKPQNGSEDEDSDTAELRLICLKSALLKKAIEMKQKQKMRKRLSQSIHEDLAIDEEQVSRKVETENNTDIESVDMDIGSDGDEKLKEICESGENMHITELESEINLIKEVSAPMTQVGDEIDEDEDLLRAKLLTSLSKNWPNLVDPAIIEKLPNVPSPEVPAPTVKTKISLPPEKPFIIKLGDSDSEGEHEATKNLTKMHIKLSEQVDFQQKLDLFLKSTRMEVEKTKTLPDVVQQPPEETKAAPKYVAKTVRHLPKSEQIEYKNLVKRMAELEKIKQARQNSMNLNKALIPAKETLKPRNISIDASNNTTINNLEEHIAISRKKIAEESAKMLKLKDEATKLSQKYKIVATELRNITTAITLNKKEQRSVQTRLTKIRLQHQTLIKSSTAPKHSKPNLPAALRNPNKMLSSNKLQKENDPKKEEYKNQQVLKSVKVSVVNDLKNKDDSLPHPRLSIQLDVSSNKKIVKVPKSPTTERIVDITKNVNKSEQLSEAINPIVEKGGGKQEERKMQENNVDKQSNTERVSNDADDYISPLDALHSGSWAEDPNSILCPFEVGGSCKDPDCKYLHPKAPTDQ